MLIELISQSNYESFNIKLAHLLGLEEAVYLNLIIEINEKAIRKSKVEDNYFYIDRDYVESRTTLKEHTQLKIEEKLSLLDIVGCSADRAQIKLHMDTLISLLKAEDEDLENDLSKMRRASSKRTQGACILNAVKNHINVNTPPELHQAYSEWLDAIYQKFNFVNKESIIAAQNIVDAEANHDLDVALAIVHLASQYGYRDMQWAVNLYRKNNQTLRSNVKETRELELRTDVYY